MLKSYTVLSMFDKFMQGKTLNINECCLEYKISVPTFRRYISLIRDYVWENHQKTIIYDKEKNGYYIQE